MKRILQVFILLCSTSVAFGQVRADYGAPFSFKIAEESEPRLILADSYNTYLLTNINVHGMLSNHEVIVRKFDQKNQLVDTYRHPFPELDKNTLFNYVGTAAMPGNTKQLIFTESYSGKADKQELYAHIFNKSTGSFTTNTLKSYPMEAIMKKGVLEFEISENSRYIGILSIKNSTKKEAVENTLLMIDAATGLILWTKEVPLDMKHVERSFTVTNGGRAVLVRAVKASKENHFLTVVSSQSIEDKQLGDALELHAPKAVSIGTQDYLIGFNHEIRTVRAGNDFNRFLLYDIDNGKMISNVPVNAFMSLTDIKEVEIKNVFIQNNEFHIFAEARVKAGVRQVKTNQFSTMSFPEPFYKYGPAYLMIMDFDGKLKSTVKLDVNQNSIAEYYSSFGLMNVKGDYRIIGSGSSIYKWTAENNFKTESKETITFPTYDMKLDSRDWGSWDMVPHLFSYSPDSKKYIVGRYYNNQLSLVSVTDK